MGKKLTELTILMPFSAHEHFRQAEAMISLTTAQVAKIYCGAVAMGNLKQRPILTYDDVCWYRGRLINHLPPDFILIIPLLLTAGTTVEIIARAHSAGVYYLKLIPNGTSTQANSGIELPNLTSGCREQLSLMQQRKIGLLLHLELIKDPKSGLMIDPRDREERALPYAEQLIEQFPDLPISFEHVSSRRLAELINQAPDHIMGSVTPQHLCLTYDQVIDKNGKLNPDNYCLPIAKSPEDRDCLLQLVTAPDNFKFMHGPDSAPHPLAAKLGPNPPAGIYNPFAFQIMVEIFGRAKALGQPDILANFTYRNAARFYCLPPDGKAIQLVRRPWRVPALINNRVRPFWAGQTLNWRVKQNLDVS
jgi:dihydroorotase